MYKYGKPATTKAQSSTSSLLSSHTIDLVSPANMSTLTLEMVKVLSKTAYQQDPSVLFPAFQIIVEQPGAYQ